MNATPPRLAEWLLEQLLPSDAGAAALGDLNEEFAAAVHRVGAFAARRWYWTQAMSLLRAFASRRFHRDRSRTDSSSGRSEGDAMRQDVRYALRALRRSPTFTSIAILVLALGIGATSAIFSFVDGVLLRPLPYRDPARLVVVWERPPGFMRNVVSALNFMDWQHDNAVFESIAAGTNAQSTLSTTGDPIQVNGGRVSASYFDMLGIGAALGRTFATGEDQPGHERIVVLSHRLWQKQFAGDPTVLGRSILLDGEPHTVIGILPANGPFDRGWAQLWRPLAFGPGERTRDYHWLRVTARLKPDVTFEQAQANMDAVGARIARDYPHSNKDWGVHLDRVPDMVVGSDLRTSLKVLLAAVGLLLLLACANLANLSLARGTAREREVVVRAALGASRTRILRQFLTESVLLSAAGGALGIGVGYGLMQGLRRLLPPLYLPREAVVAMDGRVLAFAAVISIATGVLFGIAPAIQASRIDLAGTMRASSRGATFDRSRRRLRDSLVVAEIAIACLLLAGAGLLVRSFFALQQVDAAQDPDHVLTAQLFAAPNRFSNPDQARAYYQRVLERVRAVPGVGDGALASSVPLGGWTDGMPFTIARTKATGSAGFKRITPAYFRTIGLPIVRGRGITTEDRKGTTPVIVIDEQFASRYFPDRDAIGEHLLIQEILPGQPALGPEIPWEIVGVVKTERASGLGLGANTFPGSYASIEQAPTYGLNIVVRTTMDSAGLAPALRAAVKEIDQNQPVTDVRTVADIKNEFVTPDRFRTWLLSVFSGIALMLAAVGIYGVISYSVAQRTQEIGIRTALGATRSGILGLVLRQASMLILVGLVIGIAAALALTQLMSSLLFGVAPRDPLSLAIAAGVLGMAALYAAYAPARRAASVDPIQALRVD